MATDCANCAATAHGGRIRISDEETAGLIETLLRERRASAVHARRIYIEGAAFELTEGENREIRRLDLVLDDIRRLQIEKRWRDGQLLRPHA